MKRNLSQYRNHKDTFPVLRYSEVLCVENFRIIAVALPFNKSEPFFQVRGKLLRYEVLHVLHEKIFRTLCLYCLTAFP